MDFSTFLVQLNDAIVYENGPNLAFLLRPTSPHGKDLVKEFRNPTRASFSRYEGSMQSPWDEIAIQYVLVCTHVAKKRSLEAFKEEAQLVSLFFRFFTETPGWTLPALCSILRDLRDLAIDADHYAKYNNQKSECMEESARVIAKAFSYCVMDRQSPLEQSRKWGVYYLVGLVMKCYFRIKRISLSKNILRALEANNDIPALSLYPRAHQVTYRYYIGMLSFLNEEFAKSEEQLTLAFYNCHVDSHSNQERILAHLIPLRILKGHLPSTELMKRFPVLDELFSPFITAIKKGDIKSYDQALEAWETRLLELNLWLSLEKARELCLRSLFRRMWVAVDKGTRLPISLFHSALTVSGLDVTDDEAECLVANLIFRGFIRGYISHERKMVVLASTNAFPPVADRPSPLSSI
ncbi:Protein CSN12-like protein [Psilocybe cubensis]|nr:Protein CSN12-like protein [Psilocybe cubensis]KAH9482326.1 Protein CSN12-like protein [Psilocybe cubensis]